MFRSSGGLVGAMLVSGGKFSGLARCGTSAGGAGATTGSAGGGASGGGGAGSHGNAGAGGAATAGAGGPASAGGGGGRIGTAGSASADGVPSISAAIAPTPTVVNNVGVISVSILTDPPFPVASWFF
jgi:hypothetical protein